MPKRKFTYEPREPEAVPESPTDPEEGKLRLYHLKVTYCGKIGPEGFTKYAQKIFLPDRPCLVQREHVRTNAHVHMQGWTIKSDVAILKIRSDMASEHSLVLAWKEDRIKNPDLKEGCPRPSSTKKAGTVTDRGFQYMCKENRPPIYVQCFTQEELNDMHANSNGVVEDLKMKTADYVQDGIEQGLIDMSTDLQEIIGQCFDYVYEAVKQDGKRPNKHHVKSDIYLALIDHVRSPHLQRQLRLLHAGAITLRDV